MFDGNHRSGRRAVHFGGSKKKSKSSDSNTKVDILAHTSRLREERQRQAQQQRSALLLQRQWRGITSRASLARLLEQFAKESKDVTQHARVLNARLALPDDSTRRRDGLIQFAHHLEQVQTPALLPLVATCRVHRIVQACLRALVPDTSTSSAHIFLLVLTRCLGEPPAVDVTYEKQAALYTAVGGTLGVVALLSCVENGWGATTTTTQIMLWGWLRQALMNDDPMLAALLLSSPHGVHETCKQLRVTMAERDQWLSQLMQTIVGSNGGAMQCDALDDGAWQLRVLNLVRSNATRIIANVLQLEVAAPSSSATVSCAVGLVHYCWNDKLSALVGLVGRGEDIGPVRNGQVLPFMADSIEQDTDNLSDSDDEQDDDGTEVSQQQRLTTAGGSNSGHRLTKQDLQTLPKLDRLYTQERQQWCRQMLQAVITQNTASRAELVAVAQQLGQPELWLRWGPVVLGRDGTTTTTTSITQEAYIWLLSALLRSCTGLRPQHNAAAAFMTRLALARPLVDSIWQFAAGRVEQQRDSPTGLDGLAYAACTVFADLFAHKLVALRDEQFLSWHTFSTDIAAASTTASSSQIILAKSVIDCYRTLLHELYWARPVRASDVALAVRDALPLAGQAKVNGNEGARFRVLLSGTKLWNMLYERWCRLLRQSPLCSETSWWFPPMTTLGGDGPVVNMRDADAMDNESDLDEPMAEADAENRALASVFRDAKMARILTCIPQALPFEKRVQLFGALLKADKAKSQNGEEDLLRMFAGGLDGREQITIRRDHLYEDSKHQLNDLGRRLKKKVQVSFINQHGTNEAGIDGGGVFKEYIDDLIREAFAASGDGPHLFDVTPLETLTVSATATESSSLLSDYEFVGRVLGKAVYESILVEPQFCLPFLNQLLGKRNSLEDLKTFDPDYYKNLTKVLSLPATDVDGLGLTFELDLAPQSNAASSTVELVRSGRSKSVSKQNVIQYVHLVANYRLNIHGAAQVKAFLRGFRDLIPAAWVRLFSANELQKLISGDDSVRGIDVASLQRSMQYAAGYHPSQPVVQYFWEILHEMSADQQRKFLRFMTSCSRQPLLGFASLEPAPCIQQIRLPDRLFENDAATAAKSAPLPTSSTCMNLLKLPNYPTKKLMKQKLLAAIEAGAGFELT